MQWILFNKKKYIYIYRLNNFTTLRNIQHTSGNRPLKGPALGSADKYTSLLPLAWPIKPVFHLQFFHTKQHFADFSLVIHYFRSKKSRIQSYFLLFSNEKSHFVWKNLQVENQLSKLYETCVAFSRIFFVLQFYEILFWH